MKKQLEVEYIMEYIYQSNAKVNNKYMKNYDKNVESSYLMYLDAKNLYGWTMSQKLPVNGLKWKKMYLNLMKSS